MKLICEFMLVGIMAVAFLYVAREGYRVLTQVWHTDFEE